MTAHEMAGMTYEEVAALDRSKTVAILPVGAVEAHGPHLPLGTDVIIARAMARAAAADLERAGRAAVILPPIHYTAAPFGAAFAGTMSVTPATVTALVVDVARELSRHGFGLLAMANAHLDPAHLGALNAAVEKIRAEKQLAVAFPDLTRKPWALRLTDEFKSGAAHAGRYESSVVMAERPDLVRTAIAGALPANPSSITGAIRDGKTTFAEAGGPRAYFGAPAEATAGEGRATVATLGAILAEAVLAEVRA